MGKAIIESTYMEGSLGSDCTRRIDQVCELASEGLTDAKIANKLFISKHTVANYWRRLRKVYGLSSRTALVVAHLRRAAESTSVDLSKRNQMLTEQNGRLIADIARGAREQDSCSRSLALYDSVLSCTRSFIYKSAATSPYRCVSMSRSAELFGINVDDFLCYRSSWFDVVVEEDIQALIDINEPKLAMRAEGIGYVYRLKGDKPIWVVDFQRASPTPKDPEDYVVGLVIDATHLIRSGLLQPKVTRFGHT